MNRGRALILVVTALIVGALSAAEGRSGTRQEMGPAEVVEQFLRAMEARDTTLMRALALPGARLASFAGSAESGSVRVLDAGEFLRMVAETPDPYVERMPAAATWVKGDLATVSGAYHFHVGGRLTNCGFNSFQLFRVRGRWTIAHSASTIVPAQACAAEGNR
jgi:hypothetical protein